MKLKLAGDEAAQFILLNPFQLNSLAEKAILQK